MALRPSCPTRIIHGDAGPIKHCSRQGVRAERCCQQALPFETRPPAEAVLLLYTLAISHVACCNLSKAIAFSEVVAWHLTCLFRPGRLHVAASKQSQQRATALQACMALRDPLQKPRIKHVIEHALGGNNPKLKGLQGTDIKVQLAQTSRLPHFVES